MKQSIKLVILVLAAIVGTVYAEPCFVGGSATSTVRSKGVDFMFMCRDLPSTGFTEANVAIYEATTNRLVCQDTTSVSPYKCDGLYPSTQYYGVAKGSPGNSVTRFYTPGECVLQGDPVLDCVQRVLVFTCANGADKKAALEIINPSETVGVLFTNITSPYLLPPTFISGATAATSSGVAVAGVDANGVGVTKYPACKVQRRRM